MCLYVCCFVCTQISTPEYTKSFIDLAPGVYSPEGLALAAVNSWARAHCSFGPETEHGGGSVSPSCLIVCTYQLSPISTHHHPSPPKALHHRIKWPQACHPDICGHEILWEFGVEPPEGHRRLPAVTPAVCLLGKQVGGWCSQHGTVLHPASPRLPRVPRKYPICGLQLGVQHEILHQKLTQLTVQASICEKKKVRLGSITSSTQTISTGDPQGCVLSLYCSPSTQMTAPQWTLLWNSSSLQTTSQSSVSFGTLTRLHEDRR